MQYIEVTPIFNKTYMRLIYIKFESQNILWRCRSKKRSEAEQAIITRTSNSKQDATVSSKWSKEMVSSLCANNDIDRCLMILEYVHLIPI